MRCSLALSAPDGDIINVNCTNCTVIVRDVVFFFSLSLSFIYITSSPYSSQLLSSLAASLTSHLLSSRAPAVPFLLAERERLHLHLNLAVDLAVVRGHHSCRGKGRL